MKRYSRKTALPGAARPFAKEQPTTAELGEPRQATPAPTMIAACAVVLCVLLPAWVCLNSAGDGYDSWALALVSSVLAGARFSWIAGSSRRRLFELAIWLYFYLFLGLAPLVQLRDRFDPGTTPALPHEYDTEAMIIILGAQVSLVIGSFFGAHVRTRAGTKIRRPNTRATAVVSVLLLIVSAGFAVVTGVGNLFASREGRDVAVAAVISDDVARTVIVAFVSLGLMTAVVCQLIARREDPTRGRNVPVLLTISLVVLFCLVNPLGSPRFVLMTVVLGVLAAAGLYRNIWTYRLVAMGSIAGMLLIFPILDSFRRLTSSSIEESDPLSALKAGDFDSYGQVLNGVMYVNENGITWGNQLLGVLLFWVPRSLWDTKPLDTGILLADFRGYWFKNLSAPLPIELYLNLGWVGVIAGMVFLGLTARQLDRVNELTIQRAGAPTVLGCVLPFYLVLVLRGSLLQAAATLAVILIVWLVSTSSSRDEDVPRQLVSSGKNVARE